MGGKTAPAAPAPVTETAVEVAEAGRRQRESMQKRQGFGSTLYAGSTDTPFQFNKKLGGGQ